jgi:hypothetical protein
MEYEPTCEDVIRIVADCRHGTLSPFRGAETRLHARTSLLFTLFFVLSDPLLLPNGHFSYRRHDARFSHPVTTPPVDHARDPAKAKAWPSSRPERSPVSITASHDTVQDAASLSFSQRLSLLRSQSHSTLNVPVRCSRRGPLPGSYHSG